MDNNILIDFENIYVNYGMTTVLKEINLQIKKNENWVILGANGSGKSTLLKLFSHDLYPNTEYHFKKEIFGKDRWDIFELKKHLGIISNALQSRFSDFSPSATAYDIVLSGYYSSLGVYRHHSFSSEQLKKVDQVMEFLEILRLKDKKFSQMSSGEQRRCLIGRSLIHSPEFFILDEPTTGLDIKAQCCFIKTLRKMVKTSGIILVTHDVGEIFPEITHTALIYNKTIYKQGKKETILTSANLSEIFEADINLAYENERYYIKSIK